MMMTLNNSLRLMRNLFHSNINIVSSGNVNVLRNIYNNYYSNFPYRSFLRISSLYSNSLVCDFHANKIKTRMKDLKKTPSIKNIENVIQYLHTNTNR